MSWFTHALSNHDRRASAGEGPKPTPPRFRPALTALEDRTVPSFSNGVLTLNGDIFGPAFPTNDLFEISRFRVGTEISFEGFRAKMNGAVVFEGLMADVSQVVVNGGGRNDILKVTFATATPIPSGGLTFNGGSGDDVLQISMLGSGSATFVGGGGTDRVEASTGSGAHNLTLGNGVLSSSVGGTVRVGLNRVSEAVLTGGSGPNVLDASAFTLGSVTLVGGAGNDTLRGGSRNDILEGGDGDDSMTGGAGDDRYVFRPRAFFDSNTETDTVDERDTLSSNGFDTLDFSALAADDPVNVFLNNPLQLAAHTKRIVRATVNNIGDFTRVEAAIGGRGDDTLGGEARIPNLLQGGPGDDHLIGGPETDTVGGIADQDTLEGGDGDDILEGGAGNDVLDGGPGNDTLFGGPGINTWVLDGTTGDDFLNLTFQFPGSQNRDLLGTRRQTAGGMPVETDAASGIGILQVEGLDGDDTIDLSALGHAGPAFGTTIDGGAGNDTLIGSDRDETFSGGEGDDQMFGNGGDDMFSGAGGTDSALGGADNDTADTTVETFDGGPGQDGIVVFGTAGNDYIRVSRRLGPNGAQAVVEINGQTVVMDYLNGETVTVYAGAGNDYVVMDESVTRWTAAFFGGDGNDLLVGGVLGDYLDGGDGNDLLVGGDGDDTLVGGDGHDLLYGGAGADVIRADDGVADIIYVDADDFLAVDVRDVVIRA